MVNPSSRVTALASEETKQLQTQFISILKIPLIMWLILVFLDGQYYACARTDWTGRFVIVDKGEPQKWCEPTNGTSYMERMSLTQTWYFQSQAFGFGILLVCVLLFGAFKCLRTQPTDEKDQDEEEPNIGSASKLTEASQEDRL
ncbi:uncharacterized protein LOC114857166 isoform X2 [Betta splendens]|uniref:Uncharacterized protein LOC114857166 isoform X2 n=1 Tax=Betta splendens TaxID=158456 RepID=A0A6P7MSL1_BETSP|nr:uncharacterized protein LOC114857166 isoform X2 [Betta splendens]